MSECKHNIWTRSMLETNQRFCNSCDAELEMVVKGSLEKAEACRHASSTGTESPWVM